MTESNPRKYDLESRSHELVERVAGDPPFCRVSDLLVAQGERILAREHLNNEPAGSHDLFSVTKTILAVVTGIALGEGRLSLETPVSFAPRLRDFRVLDRVTVRHVLTLQRGAATEGRFELDEVAVSGINWAIRFASAPQLEAPGTKFRYDNGAAQLLSELLHEVVGDLCAYTEERLFKPLDIQTWKWDRDPTGVPAGPAHLSMDAESLAKIGLLLCRSGEYAGEQILDPRWIRSMQTISSVGGPPEGRPYGMGLWIESREVFFGAGWAGQLLLCRPRDELVVVSQSNPGFDYGPPARDSMPDNWTSPLELVRTLLL